MAAGFATAPSVTCLSDRQLVDYDRDGFLMLRQVFDRSEINALDAEAQELLQRADLIHSDNIRCRWQNHIETGQCTFECFDPVIDLGTICGRIANDQRILGPLSQIYRDTAHLFKDKLIYKPPGTKGYALHQDYIGWKSFPKSFVTVLVAIDPADEQNGATEVFPGYHQQEYLSPKDGMYHDLPLSAIDESRGVKLDLAPGDIAIFGCFTPHRSAPNRTNRWRRQLYLSYNAGRDGGSQRDAHYAEFCGWLKERYAEYGKHGVYFR